MAYYKNPTDQAFWLGTKRGIMILCAVFAIDQILALLMNSLRNILALSGLVFLEGVVLSAVGIGPAASIWARVGLTPAGASSWPLTLAGIILAIGGATIFILVGTGHIPCLGCSP